MPNKASEYQFSEKGALALEFLRKSGWQPQLNVVFDGVWIEKRFKSDAYLGLASKISRYESNCIEPVLSSQFNRERDVHYDSMAHRKPREPGVSARSLPNIDSTHGHKNEDAPPFSEQYSLISGRNPWQQSTPEHSSTADEIIIASQQQVKRMVDRRRRQGEGFQRPTHTSQSCTDTTDICNEHKNINSLSENSIPRDAGETSDDPLFCLLSPSMLVLSPGVSIEKPVAAVTTEDFTRSDIVSATQTTVTSEVERLVGDLLSPGRSSDLLRCSSEENPVESEASKNPATKTIELASCKAQPTVYADNSATCSRKPHGTTAEQTNEEDVRSIMGPPSEVPPKRRNIRLSKKIGKNSRRREKSVAGNTTDDTTVVDRSYAEVPSTTNTSSSRIACEDGDINIPTYPELTKETPSDKSVQSNDDHQVTRLHSDKLVTDCSTQELAIVNMQSSQTPVTKKRRFITPLKPGSHDTRHSLNTNKTNPDDDAPHSTDDNAPVQLDARQLAVALQDQALDSLQLCVEYVDGGSSLRPVAVSQNCRQRATASTIAAVVCMFSGGALHDKHVRVCCDNTRQLADVLPALLATDKRRVCYDGQTVMLLALRRCAVPLGEAVLGWHVHDPRVAVWLLQPDRPPATFAGIVEWLDMRATRDATLSRRHQLLHDLRQQARVHRLLEQQLADHQLTTVYEQLEVPLTPLLAGMQHVGVRVDVAQMHRAAAQCRRRLRWLETTAHRHAGGRRFQLTSTVQLRAVLYDQLQLDRRADLDVKTTAAGVKSTCESVLRLLAPHHPLPAVLVEHRRVQKLMCTYVDGLLSHVRDATLYPQWQQTAAATGRVQATSPNIQSVPRQPLHLTSSDSADADKHDDHGDVKTIVARAAFVARAGHCFLSADFRQMELRLLAHLSGDRQLIDAINTADSRAAAPDGDIFRQLSGQWNKIAPDQVSAEQRERTKRVVYSAMYGVGAASLADALHCDQQHAQRLITSFLQWCPAVDRFTKHTIDVCRQTGCLVSLAGRKRWFSAIKSTDQQERMHAARQAVNFRVQGSAADVSKLAAVAVATAAPHTRLLAQLHDELLWEVPEQQVRQFGRLVRATVARLPELLRRQCAVDTALTVELPVKISVGANWAALQAEPFDQIQTG